jgi:hypothetical protein
VQDKTRQGDKQDIDDKTTKHPRARKKAKNSQSAQKIVVVVTGQCICVSPDLSICITCNMEYKL